jgi:hypothetical protein
MRALVSVGLSIHYVSHGTPVRADGSQAFPSVCRAGLITEVLEDRVGLCVFNPTGIFFHPESIGGGAAFDEGGAAGTWHHAAGCAR